VVPCGRAVSKLEIEERRFRYVDDIRNAGREATDQSNQDPPLSTIKPGSYPTADIFSAPESFNSVRIGYRIVHPIRSSVLVVPDSVVIEQGVLGVGERFCTLIRLFNC